MTSHLAARVFAALTGIVMAFQIALALGAPWGAYAMGGAFPAAYGPGLRLVAAANVLILGAFAGVVLARAGLAFPSWRLPARRLIWIIVTLTGIILILNLITPSPLERLIWAPIAAGLFAAALRVAVGSS